MMKILKIFTLISVSLAFTPTLAQAWDNMQSPWLDSQAAIIIDAYYGNAIDWEELKKDSKMVAIIHKASEGLQADPKYQERKEEAFKRGYLWGSYHLARSGDPMAQADFYLKQVQASEKELLALDLEDTGEKSMSFDDAKKFILRIKEKTGRYPLLYGNHQTIEAIDKKFAKDEVFSKTQLWYARFRKDIPALPQNIWSQYALWQFSSEINCKKGKESDCL